MKLKVGVVGHMEARDSNYVGFLLASGEMSSVWAFSLSCIVEFSLCIVSIFFGWPVMIIFCWNYQLRISPMLRLGCY